MDSRAVSSAVSVTAVAVAVVFAAALVRRSWYSRVPHRWVAVGVVSHLRIYPLKSGKGIACGKVRCGPTGVEFDDAKDRMFLVIDSNGKCLSGRECSRMTGIVAEVTGRRLTLIGEGSSQRITVDLPQDRRVVRLRIWNAPAEGLDCGSKVSDWLTNYLQWNSRLRLLYRGDDVTGKGFIPGMQKVAKMLRVRLQPSDAGLFSDTFAYHLISEASITDLNTRMTDERVSSFHFRPNVVVGGEGLVPFEEDRWRWVKIGKVVFRCIAPSMRCSFTTLDPDTGEKSEHGEPITTLRRYRFVRERKLRELVYTPTMGVYLGVRREGEISVGDVVAVPEGGTF